LRNTALVHLAPIKNDEILNQRILLVKPPATAPESDIVRQSMIRHLHACIDSVGGHFEHFLGTVIC